MLLDIRHRRRQIVDSINSSRSSQALINHRHNPDASLSFDDCIGSLSSVLSPFALTDQRNRDVIGDTALLSAFISLQACVSDLESLKLHLDRQRQHFETLQEKLTALRDAR